MLWFDFRTLDMATLMANVHFVALDSSAIGLNEHLQEIVFAFRSQDFSRHDLMAAVSGTAELPAGVKKISKNLHESSYSLTIHQY